MPIENLTSGPATFFDPLKAYDKEIEKTEKNNGTLKKLIEYVKNSATEKGYLRADKENMLYLKKKLTLGTLIAKLNIIRQEKSENIKTLELNLKLGQKICREDLVSHLENVMSTNNLHIEACKGGKQDMAARQQAQMTGPLQAETTSSINESNRMAQAQESHQLMKPPSPDTIYERKNPQPDTQESPLADHASPKPSLSPRTIRGDGSPIPKRRSDTEHINSLHKEIGTIPKIFDKILDMKCEKLDAQKIEGDLCKIKEQFNAVQFQPIEGLLLFSDEKGLHLSSEHKSLKKSGLNDGGAAELKKKLPGLDLGVGKIAVTKEINSRIDQLLREQKAYISSLDKSIERQQNILAFLKKQKSQEVTGGKQNSNTSALIKQMPTGIPRT